MTSSRSSAINPKSSPSKAPRLGSRPLTTEARHTISKPVVDLSVDVDGAGDGTSIERVSNEHTARLRTSRNGAAAEQSTPSSTSGYGLITNMATGPTRAIHTSDGTSTADDSGTMISFVDGKPPSVGAKSIASGVTFAMDEKESLRPDDSASIAAAAEDEELIECTRPQDSSHGSDEGVRAFREQLNEITAIDPLRRTTLTGVNEDGAPAQGVLYVPVDLENPVAPPLSQTQAADQFGIQPDAKLIEALENPRDRIWVLKLEQDVIDFVKDAKESSLVLPQCNSFYRMLAHKIAEYYMLGHSVDDSNSAVRLFKSPSCRIPRPLTGIATPSTAASTPPPSLQMKILRRGVDISGPAIANGSNMPSKGTSETGESCGEDDPRKPVTREEREARYEAARLRIMGSAKPAEQTETKDDSRSSSVSGRKGRKTRRDANDDDFEARSAYNLNAYMAPSIAQSGTYQVQQYTQGQQYGQPQYAVPVYPQQVSGAQPWYGPGTQELDSSATWQSTNMYDLSRDLDRALSFQQPVSPYSAPQSPFAQMTFQQPFAAWPQGGTTMNDQAPAAYSQNMTYSDRPSSSASQSSYAYGQLPSQALGRPPNALEHPLPGSYKSRHFNPQSQSFIPSHGTGNMFRPFMPQRTISGPNSAALPSTPSSLERQMSSHSQSSHLGSPGHQQSLSRLPTQLLTHPLPQPVFPSQPLQSASLPPRPPAQHTVIETNGSSTINHMSGQDSTIAKWGNIPSLPAKPPPPSVEKRDGPPVLPQRNGYVMPAFGSMPAGGSI